MKTSRKAVLIFFLGMIFNGALAQTPIGGMIDTHITLKKADSPFLVTSDLVISPDGKIVIEPGVEVRFAQDVKLEVRGILVAEGTASDSITFTSASESVPGSWVGVDIKSTQGGSASFSYSNFLYASTAVMEECCHFGSTSVRHSSFLSNTTAIGGYKAITTLVDSCYFSNNVQGISGADKLVTNSLFENNEYGLSGTERVSVSNSVFRHHTQAALHGGRGEVSNSTIEDNAVGVRSTYEGFTLKNNTISNNEIGIELGIYDGLVSLVEDNQICNNSVYNVKNFGALNVELYKNCWCSSDSTTVEDKILDGLDDPKLGLTSYDLFNSTCDSVLQKVDKTISQVTRWVLANSPYLINQHYLIFPNDTLIIEPGVEVRFAQDVKLEVRGTLVAEGTLTDSITFTSASGSVPGSWVGVDIKSAQGGSASFSYSNFLYASTAVMEECCHFGSTSIRHSSFLSNITAIGGYKAIITVVDSCYFSNNVQGISGADKSVTNSLFENNEYGLAGTERVNVSNSVFRHHTQAALHGGRGEVSNSTIEDNAVGVRSTYEGFTLKNNTISNNEIGIELGIYDGLVSPVEDNQICNNSVYNVKNYGALNVELYKNCWCSSDSTTVEDKILDGLDDPGLGLTSYDLFNSTCDTVLQKVDKTISQVTRWVLANSPYFINQHYLIFPNDTLIIEPGVEVRFAQDVKLEVRGTLVAEGTASDSITFTSSSGSVPGNWVGVDIRSVQGGSASFSYSSFSYASTAVTEECCHFGSTSIRHSSFLSNITAIGGYKAIVTEVDSCYFSNNVYSISGADKLVTNSLFENNENGLSGTERVNVSNSVFRHHTQVALYGGRGEVSNCTIENNAIGVKSFYEGFTLKNNTISNNEIGIELSNYGGTVSPIEDNMICNNSDYNVKNLTALNVELFTNCWCSSDSTTVEDKILDGWDDTALGLADYTLTSANCETPIYKTDKAHARVIYFVTGVSPIAETTFQLYPNPTSGSLFVDDAVLIQEVSLYDPSGKRWINHINRGDSKIQIDLKNLSPGLYLVELKTSNGRSSFKKIILKS